MGGAGENRVHRKIVSILITEHQSVAKSNSMVKTCVANGRANGVSLAYKDVLKCHMNMCSIVPS